MHTMQNSRNQELKKEEIYITYVYWQKIHKHKGNERDGEMWDSDKYKKQKKVRIIGQSVYFLHYQRSTGSLFTNS